MVRREKKDVLKELPSLTRNVVWIESDKQAEKALKSAVLNQRANAMYEAVRATAEAKLEPAVELAAQAKRFVLFTYERKHAEEIGHRLDKRGTGNVVIHGGLSVERRRDLVTSAARSGLGICATIDSTGAGVNLQGIASTAIFHVLDWVPLKLAQAEARIHRLGQTEPCTVYYLVVKESVDQAVINTAVNKLDQFRATLGHESNRALRDDLQGTATEADALAAIFAELNNDG